ncbi:hypothetical protein B0H16DRAFT_1712475 [Mycena metata]|uniref:Uncharacterized protein n=1 Tax=Mycena metata TaxID=1033252 RepID=A0AAD7K120_9AGAR|nr:hypothetical protein B0H16DRAFT_1712475 [Mycena metata]
MHPWGSIWHDDCRTRIDVGVPGANILRSAVVSTKALEHLSIFRLYPRHTTPFRPGPNPACNPDLDLQAHDPSQARILLQPSLVCVRDSFSDPFPRPLPLPLQPLPLPLPAQLISSRTPTNGRARSSVVQ